MTSRAEGIHAEAAESIVSADRAAAEEVATLALAGGLAPADIMQTGMDALLGV